MKIINKCIRKLFKSKQVALVKDLPQLGRPRGIDVFNVVQTNDYVRLSTLELCAHELHRRNVHGNCAEVGVYQGYFASQINILFPDKKLYLFDTFEGFDSTQLLAERKLRGLQHSRDFSQTSEGLVMSKMKHPERCIVKKGFFPASAEGIIDTFAFVSLDTDLYEPIKHGLMWFYARLSPNGMILVHDYNNVKWPGVRQAVHEFAEDAGVTVVPVSDAFGSAIITKCAAS